jgi:hypothetical protein
VPQAPWQLARHVAAQEVESTPAHASLQRKPELAAHPAVHSSSALPVIDAQTSEQAPVQSETQADWHVKFAHWGIQLATHESVQFSGAAALHVPTQPGSSSAAQAVARSEALHAHACPACNSHLGAVSHVRATAPHAPARVDAAPSEDEL